MEGGTRKGIKQGKFHPPHIWELFLPRSLYLQNVPPIKYGSEINTAQKIK